MIYLFSNTLWFLVNFKKELIEALLKKYDVTLLYLSDGPPNKYQCKQTYGSLYIQKLTLAKAIKLQLERSKTKAVLSFTIIPIILTPLILKADTKIATIEGLGRVFSSRRIIYRVLKRGVEFLYRILFFNYYTKISVLNYFDYTYLLGKKIVPLSSLVYQPGTGINLQDFPYDEKRMSILKQKIVTHRNNSVSDKIRVSMVSRLQPEKGFLVFIASRLALQNEFPTIYEQTIFQLIAPQKDIMTIPTPYINYLNNIGIILIPYKTNASVIYDLTDILVHPSQYAEGLSRIVLEAGAVGIPLIVSPNRGIIDIVPNSSYGYISTESPSPSQIAKYIQEIISDIENTFVKVQKLRERIEYLFTSDRATEIVLSQIDE